MFFEVIKDEIYINPVLRLQMIFDKDAYYENSPSLSSRDVSNKGEKTNEEG